MSIRVRKYHPIASTAQCTKYGGFGHLYSFCKKKDYSCLLCSKNYATEQHYYSVCKKNGTKCLYLALKYINCKGTYTADSKEYEVYLVVKNRPVTNTAEAIIIDENEETL
jgi:hypothetical protein